MPASISEIIANFVAFINEHGGAGDSWYVGIASDPRDRLVRTHGVQEDVDIWLFRGAPTVTAARGVLYYFVNEFGVDGGHPDDGTDEGPFVYLYKKAVTTRP
ncbi:MAG: hypothetical protein B7X04_01405 [Parcubacteria group bacterium 21-54-25]|nr:MAG: hypothetical protein B7X04_01405 [Parcubacteria group bacterium 21-54-25]HQU07586.1 hypothetical protein [Candidatus Paceibacterota bacterium]